MNILVICTGYPSKDQLYNCYWAHMRCKYYRRYGIKVDVLSLQAKNSYIFDGVSVITKGEAIRNINFNKYSAFLSHSPNIRQHIPFLLRVEGKPIIIFCHGTESMKYDDYPRPFDYMKRNFLLSVANDCYEMVKFPIMRFFIRKNRKTIKVVFVSEWMKNIFSKNVFDVDEKKIEHQVINNPLGEHFIRNSYYPSHKPAADFVTIRRFDLSKYAVDLVVRCAIANPDKTFHLFGGGDFFRYHKKPDNLKVFYKFLDNSSIPEILCNYRCALMPTRCDAQGVMLSEIASFGMPVITSDIDVNHEMFSSYGNVKLIENEKFGSAINFSDFDFSYDERAVKERFSYSNTIEKEIRMVESFISLNKC